MTSDTNEQIAKMQEFLAHQDKQIQELNDIVTIQANEIAALTKYMRATKNKMSELENHIGELNQDQNMSVSDIAAAEKPQHY